MNVSAARGFWRRWLDRHVPMTGPDLSRLDIMDGAGPSAPVTPSTSTPPAQVRVSV
jgi:hypothetical protein